MPNQLHADTSREDRRRPRKRSVNNQSVKHRHYSYFADRFYPVTEWAILMQKGSGHE